MEENIQIFDSIERHILRQMSDCERESFENELSNNPDLQYEYDLHREIISATQRIHLKAHLKHIEDEIKVRRSTMIRRVSSWSIAAAILCFCVLGLEYRVSTDLSETALLSYAQTGMPLTRSDGEIDELVAYIYKSIGENDVDATLDAISKAELLISDGMHKPVLTEEDAYQKEILKIQSDDLQWYKALAFMKEGKIIKSRKILKEIANSDSRYAEEAKNILESFTYLKF